MGCCSCKCTSLTILLIAGLISLVFAILGLVFVPRIVDNMVRKQTYLGQGPDGKDNLVLKMFRDPPYDIKLQIWTFSVQNADAVLGQGARPIVVEKGPYTFTVLMHKKDVELTSKGSLLFFRNGKTYFFNSSLSCADCRLSDSVIVPNILFQKIVDVFMHVPKWVRRTLEWIIKGRESVFINLTVDELLFKGYEDWLVKEICGNRIVKMLKICETYKIPERIGLFYGQNGTDDGLYEVDTGLNNVDQLDRVHSWNRMNGTLAGKYWYGGPARMINGTDAELFRPNLYDGGNLEIFVGQLCRSFELERRGAAITSDIPVFRYSQPDQSLDVRLQRSQGFCNPKTAVYFQNASVQEAGCAPSGLLDMSTCLPGSPRIFWSSAHFRNAPVELRLDGMEAPSEADLSYFDLEPITGVVVGVQQKSQLNLGLLKGDMKTTGKMAGNLILPLIWLNESAVIDPGTQAQLRVPLRAVYYAFLGGLGFLVAGSICLVAFAGLFIGFRIAERRAMAEAGPEGTGPRTPLVAAEQPMPTSEYPQQNAQQVFVDSLNATAPPFD